MLRRHFTNEPHGKPAIEEIRFDPHPVVDPVLLDRAFTFSRASVLRLDDYRTTQSRLELLVSSRDSGSNSYPALMEDRKAHKGLTCCSTPRKETSGEVPGAKALLLFCEASRTKRFIPSFTTWGTER